MGTLRIEGVVRGARLSADRLVHLQGFGDFMLEKVSLFYFQNDADYNQCLFDFTRLLQLQQYDTLKLLLLPIRWILPLLLSTFPSQMKMPTI